MKCLLCQQRITEELSLAWLFSWQPYWQPHLCQYCRRNFVYLNKYPHCPRCFRYQKHAQICQDCQYWQHLYPHEHCQHTALLQYNDALAQYFMQYKGYGAYHLRTVFSDLLHRYFYHCHYQYIVPITSEEKHIAQRGFDHVWGLYENVVPLTKLLAKQATAKPQAQKARQQRLQTPQSFIYVGSQQINSHARILLVDDIYTTGQTLWHARQCLRRHGFINDIDSFTLGR